MKHKIIKVAALIVLLVQLSSCYTTIHTDRQSPGHRQYRGAGRYW